MTGSSLSFELPTVLGRLSTGFKTLATLDFPNRAANQNTVLSRTIANVALNDVITIALPKSIMPNMTNWNGSFKAWVSAANTISFYVSKLRPGGGSRLSRNIIYNFRKQTIITNFIIILIEEYSARSEL